MRNIEITLGGKVYTVSQLPIGANRTWRKQFDEPVNKLLAATQGVGNLAGQEFEDMGDLMKTIGAVLVQHADSIVRVLLESPDLLLDGLYAYAPAIKADRERIEAEAFDDEIGQAFIQVVQLAYPFGALLKMAKIGQETAGTSQSSAEASGEPGRTS